MHFINECINSHLVESKLYFSKDISSTVGFASNKNMCTFVTSKLFKLFDIFSCFYTFVSRPESQNKNTNSRVDDS